jgi:flagellar hook-associated protein 3 FlgL
VRVTQGMLNQQMLYDLQVNTARLMQLQNEIATGKRINSPADDPVGVTFVMRYKSDLAYYKQYLDNANAAQSWLSYTDTVMSQAVQVVQRARDLAVQGASDTLTTADRQALAAEVEQLVTLGNSQYNGQYIFNGMKTGAAPYPSSDIHAPPAQNAANQTTDMGDILYELGDGIQLNVNTPGDTFFKFTDNTGAQNNVFNVLQQLYDALNNPQPGQDPGQAVSQLIGLIDSALDQMSATQADVGARLNRVQFEQNRLNSLVNSYTSLLASVADADMGQVITDLNTVQSVQQASLAVGARIILPTLVDFLK